MPCIIYVITKDFFNSFHKAQGIDVSLTKSLNISKILIISSIILYFILPIINLKEILNKIKEIGKKKIIILIIFCLINIFFFNFPNNNLGGGFFHKVSYLILKIIICFF